MKDVLNSVTEANKEVAEKWSSGVSLLMLICGKLALTGVLLWVCVRGLKRLRQKAHRDGRAAARTATATNTNVTAHADERRKSAWEREQKRLDELAAAALAAKQERVKLQHNTSAAALAVREAKERARASALKADEARMRRRRAEDQLRLSGDAHDEQSVRLFQEQAEEAVREDQVERQAVNRAVNKLEDLRRMLNETERENPRVHVS